MQVPSGVPTGSQPLIITTAGGSSVAFSININTTEPGLLAPLSFDVQGSQNVVALFANTLTYVLPVTIPGVKTARAQPGDKLTLYGIGFGQSIPSTVTYSGLAPGYVGLYQFNVVVPNVAASDTVPVAFTLGGHAGQQSLVIAVQ